MRKKIFEEYKAKHYIPCWVYVYVIIWSSYCYYRGRLVVIPFSFIL
jgi:hypothetical protein